MNTKDVAPSIKERPDWAIAYRDGTSCAYCTQPLRPDPEYKKFSGDPLLERKRYSFCSIECACYSGMFSVTKGWIREAPIRTGERKISNPK